MERDSYAKVRADFEALKAKLRASVEQLEPERYDNIIAGLVSLDRDAIAGRLAVRRASYRIEKSMADIEARLTRGEERERERT